MTKNYDEFCNALLAAGFSMAGGGDDGVFGLIAHNWNEELPDSPLRWHSGDPATDPWEWRMRVLEERDDIAYGKVFFRKNGFITARWYPYFLAVRRAGMTFEEAYESGKVSHFAKRIYETLACGGLPTEAIKQASGFAAADKSKFDAALTELQMKMYITVKGRQQKVGQSGEEYGWPSAVFCTTEDFFANSDVFCQAGQLCPDEATKAIADQVLTLNPSANTKKIMKFIKG